ncbi:MAG: FAD-dependent oxidoreductase [Actinomycetes bacterium]
MGRRRHDGHCAEHVFDVAVVGGGVLGAAVAARLSSTSASTCLLEAEADVGEGASKGNTGVAVSYYGGPGSLETQLINASNPGWESLCDRLDVPYRRIGAIMVALSDEEGDRLEGIRQEAEECAARAELLTARQVLEAEPLVSGDCVAGLLLPDEGIIDPMRLTIAYGQLAVLNGVDFRLGERVIAVERETEDVTIIRTSRGRVRARYVVNAAGLGAGQISALAGGEAIATWPRKGQYVVLDRRFGERLSKIVFCTHLPDTKGINVVPTVHGSALLGPTAQDGEDPDDRATDADTIAHVLKQAARLVPSALAEYAIKTFAANRPASDEQHRLRVDPIVPNLVHVTDRSAGVSISPASAEHVVALLRESGLDVGERRDAVAAVTPVPRLRSAPDPEALIDIDPLYGQVVCACEHVSAAEIAKSLEGPLPARSVDAVRKRTGATHGRCQGSLCAAGVTFLCALSTNTGPATAPSTTRGTVGS